MAKDCSNDDNAEFDKFLVMVIIMITQLWYINLQTAKILKAILYKDQSTADNRLLVISFLYAI